MLKNKVNNLKSIGFLDVCSLRLDFETLTILGPATTGEADTTGAPAPGHLCQDSFTVTVRKNCIYFHLKQIQCKLFSICIGNFRFNFSSNLWTEFRTTWYLYKGIVLKRFIFT